MTEWDLQMAVSVISLVVSLIVFVAVCWLAFWSPV